MNFRLKDCVIIACATIIVLSPIALFLGVKHGLSAREMKAHPNIDQAGAIRIAEAYVDEKGYADPLPRLETFTILRDICLLKADAVNEYFRYGRSNFIEPKVVGVTPPSDSFDRWTVGFRRKDSPNIDQKLLGFAVYIDHNFREIEEGRDVPIIFSKMKHRLRP
jgi:hypothetical protein